MGVQDIVTAAVAAHHMVRDFAVTYPEIWTAGWQLAGLVGTLFVPAWGRPLLDLAVSNVKTWAEKKPKFDKELAEQQRPPISEEV